MNIPDFTEFGYKGINWEQRCRYKYPEFFNYINNTYPNDLKFSEKIYWYLHKINEHPTCKICGKLVRYVDGHIGYKTYCSSKCVAKDPEAAQKREQTNLQKYGVKNAFQSNEIKEKIKQTNIQKYGTKYAMQNEAIKEKFYNSMMQKYGVKHALQESNIFEKAKQTLLKNYGVEYCSKNAKLLEKIYQTNMKKYGTKLPLQNPQIIQKVNQKFIEKDENVIGIEDDFFICKCPHSNCNKCQEKVFKIKRSLYSNRKYLKTELCTKLVKEKQISGTTIELFVQNLLDK
ncbi:MAG: hypothetical protein IKO36_02440, partial [Bacteroidaceae bacterium]|nr:hypothetical protein [Bacteroidaceae bacterium]